jgi:hypothetical protein
MSIIGRFYFKQTNYGNLIGEFSNNEMNRNLTESANILESYEAMYTGKYRTTWFETGTTTLILEITFREQTDNNIYILVWRNEKNETIFKGEGFIVDNILIGDYQDL